MNVASSAMTATTLPPVMNDIRSSQCEPMSPTAPERAAMAGSRRQFQSVSREQPVLEVWPVTNRMPTELARRHLVLEVLVERVEAEVEVDAFTRSDVEAASRKRAEPAAVIASGFSQTRCRPAARIAMDWSTWRSFGEVTWTTLHGEIRQE